jgi:uncharacterized protein (DUF362 family)
MEAAAAMSARAWIRRVAERGYPGNPDDPRARAIDHAVRAAMSDGGVPTLEDHVRRGGRVFVLCNFVHHRRGGREDARAQQAKCTHASVIAPVVELARRAVGTSGEVLIGNAPVQSADWDTMLAETGTGPLVERLAGTPGAPVRAVDLRGWVLGRGATERARDVVEIDLAGDSMLEGVHGNHAWRVLQYDPRRTAQYHRPGSHIYVLARDVLAADLVISVCKLKTHQKVGVTCAIKGTVGAIVEKDCLAHHRKGDPARGGDEYPGAHPLMRATTWLGERIWARDAGPLARRLRRVERAGLVAVRRLGMINGGAWHGNDTCWRMAVDIARCLRFADTHGRVMHDKPRRPHLVVVDGIIGGEGDGPLAPRPRDTRAVMFADDPVVADVAAAWAMGLDPRRIPLVAGAFTPARWPLTEVRLDDVRVSLDGADTDPRTLAVALGGAFVLPPGWRGQAELAGIKPPAPTSAAATARR